MNEVVYRKYENSDFDSLVEIILTTWLYKHYFSKKLLREIATMDLLTILYYSAYLEVAVIDNKVVGFLFGRVKNDTYNKEYEDRLNIAKQNLRSTLRGIATDNLYNRIQKLNSKMFSKLESDDVGEINLFAIHEHHRRRNIGSHLFDHFIKYTVSKGFNHIVLFTDTYSDYEFYEIKGMTRFKSRIFYLPRTLEEVKLYMYYK